MQEGFRTRLIARQKEINSLVCVGLDPLVEQIPSCIRNRMLTSQDDEATLIWMQMIVNKTAPFASMFKPQRAHWEAIPGGTKALANLIEFIKVRYPEIPVFLDCKRGDIDRTQRQYREAHFTLDGADGINYNGYMGRGTLENLIDRNHPERALVGLGRTSNPDAWEIQDEKLACGMRVWERMVYRIHKWSTDLGVLENAGVVMGAAHSDPWEKDKIYSKHLTVARELVGNSLWFLIPGIGKQGGFVRQTIQASFTGPGSIAINNSSAINFASSGSDYAEAAAGVAELMRDVIRREGGNC